MSMRARVKNVKVSARYPKWLQKEDSPSKRARERDGNVCRDCGIEQYAIVYNPTTGIPHINYLHGSHVHFLDPDYQVCEPIEDQKLRPRCPSCHRKYDLFYEQREREVNHQCKLHQIALEQELLTGRFTYIEKPTTFIMQRFMHVD